MFAKMYASVVVRQYVLVITATLSLFCSGLGMAWASPVVAKLTDTENPVFDTPISLTEASWVVSIGGLAGVFTTILPALVIDRFGRKISILVSAASKVPIGFMFIFAPTTWVLLVARFALGISDSFLFGVILVYAAEIASTDIRGALTTLFQVMVVVGVLVMMSIGPFISYLALNIMYTVFIIITLIPLFFIPETPYHLCRIGKKEEAVKVLSFYRNSEEEAREEIKSYELEETDEKPTTKVFAIIKQKTFLKALGIGLIFGIGNPLLGYGPVVAYIQEIINSTETVISGPVASALVGVVQLLASLFTVFVTDRVGRRPLLIISLIGIMLGMLSIGAYFKVAEGMDEITGFLSYVPIISLLVVVFCFGAGVSSVMIALMAELFESEARPLGLVLGAPVGALVGFLVAFFYAAVLQAIGAPALFWIFSANALLMLMFVIVCIPETKGKTFAEIQIMLGADPTSVSDDKESGIKDDAVLETKTKC